MRGPLLSNTTGSFNTANGAFALFSNTGFSNTASGDRALLSNTTGAENTAAGSGALISNTTGNNNTANGASALVSNTTADNNTATGFATLFINSTGTNNTATGAFALRNNTASNNTATGFNALFSNTTGTLNTATGGGALVSNTTGSGNTASGVQALFNNTTATANTADGFQALLSNVTGIQNTAIGAGALHNNTVDNNTAIGVNSLSSNTTGNGDTANGVEALLANTTGGFNTAIGFSALHANSSGSENVAIGDGAGLNVTTANNVICIGAGVVGENVGNSCYIGHIYANIQPIVGTNPDSVTIASTGRLGRGNVSSRRYKHHIKPMDKASEVLFALKPVSFRYNKQYDATQTLAFGLIAEDVAEVNPDLVGRNPNGEPESVRYEQINAMLLNEFLKEHTAFLEEQRKVQKLETALETVNERLKEQEAKIQRVSAQIDVSNAAPQMVAIDR